MRVADSELLLPDRSGHEPEAVTDPTRGGLRSWTRRHPVLLASVATMVVHLLFLSRKLGSDEGGFAMVARHWGQPGGYLYGRQDDAVVGPDDPPRVHEAVLVEGDAREVVLLFRQDAVVAVEL